MSETKDTSLRDRLAEEYLRDQKFIDLFWSRVQKNKQCWLWRGKRDRYGMIQFNHKVHMAHRISYELKHGKIKNSLFVCHKCDVKGCVNPDHLWLGTQSENMLDAAKKKIIWQTRREKCPRGHKYIQYDLSIQKRTCRTCANLASRNHRSILIPILKKCIRCGPTKSKYWRSGPTCQRCRDKIRRSA